MNQKLLYTAWGFLFILCAALGFIPEPEGKPQLLLTVLSVLFFLPPALILQDAGKKQDPAAVKLVRNLSALSLGLTLVLLIFNFLTVMSSDFWGQVLHYTLAIVSAPMICSGHWALSLFLWACLLVASLQQLRRNKR